MRIYTYTHWKAIIKGWTLFQKKINYLKKFLSLVDDKNPTQLFTVGSKLESANECMAVNYSDKCIKSHTFIFRWSAMWEVVFDHARDINNNRIDIKMWKKSKCRKYCIKCYWTSERDEKRVKLWCKLCSNDVLMTSGSKFYCECKIDI